MTTVAGILNPAPYTVREDDALLDAVGIAFAKRIRTLPVVDAQRRYRGMISLHRILSLLLPRAALIDDGLADLSFAGDTIDELKRKLAALAGRTVADLMDHDVAPIHPDTQIVEAALLMFRRRDNLPVVERDTGLLAGLISPWEILERLV